MLEKAILVATSAHKGQTDKAGEPYILHLLRVMFSRKSEAEKICAVLHDVWNCQELKILLKKIMKE